MNITFLVICFTIVLIVYLFKNILKIPIRGLNKYLWLLLCIVLLMFCESIIGLTNWITFLPHSYLITFLLHFLVIPIILIILYKITNNRKIPPLLKNYFVLPFWISFFSLLWIYVKDSEDKLFFFKDPPVLLHVLLIGLLVSNLLFIVQSSKELTTHNINIRANFMQKKCVLGAESKTERSKWRE